MHGKIVRLSFALFAAVALATSSVHADHNLEAVQALDVPGSATTQMNEECHIVHNLTVGSRGADVSCLQVALIEHGMLNQILTPTGFFGELTKSAVQKWQEGKGLPATGFFGPLSRETFAHHADEDAAESSEVHAEPEMHAHVPLDVSTWPSVPSVTIVLHKDSMSGYNLEIKPVNFIFAPEHVNGAVVPNEGHAHVMVGGVKLARVYGNWFHIPKEAFKTAGSHEILVTLNANDHSDLAVGGVRVEAKETVTTE